MRARFKAILDKLTGSRVLVLCLLSLFVCGWAGISFKRALERPVKPFFSCVDVNGEHDAGTADFRPCIQEEAKLFIERDFAESKDAAKTFLTLLVGVFVASITFSEKIVNVAGGTPWTKGAMVLCWVLILIAIASCGAALALMIIAAGVAAHQPDLNYYVYENDAAKLWLFSGLVFGTSLVSLFVAGVLALLDRQRPTAVYAAGKEGDRHAGAT
jgi:hypothetical protein